MSIIKHRIEWRVFIEAKMTVACLRGLCESCHYRILTSQMEKLASNKVEKMKRMKVSQAKIP